MFSRVKWIGLGCASVLLSQGPSQAHEEAIGLTEITVYVPAEDVACTPQACRVEVAHRLSIHDAESTLMSVLGARADLVNDPAAQEKFQAYVTDRFVLVDASTEAAIPLAMIGGEVERGYYWVYQEASLSERLDSMVVTQGVLMDAIPQQTNRVNIVRDGETNTLVFSADPGPQSFSFD